ncbi:MAG TPA: zinc ribbon domain-containing protein [Clostridia bacterium]|nr:zinc ribbon domain-containing protein [Clostridia bacterium]
MSKITLSLIVVTPLLLLQATWIFMDARKRGEKYYWAWGLLGLLNFPTSLIIYLIVTRHGYLKCPDCGKTVKNNYKYCPYCGNALKKTCPTCGIEIKEDWRYCPECSRKL